MRRRDDAYPSGGDRLADSGGIPIRVNERIGLSELLQPMHVAVADDGLSVPAGPPLRGRVEVHRPREHPIPFDGIKKMRVPREGAAQRAERWKERMRRDDKPPLTLAQPSERLERTDRFGGAAVIEQQHMTPFDRPLDARNEHDSALGGVRTKRRRIELPIVKGDSQTAKAQIRCSVDKLVCLVRN